MDDHAPGTLSPGTTFAERYRVVRCISSGGMGAIYDVVHLPTQRRRALKVMLPGLADDADIRGRFEREVTIASSVKSEHVVEVLDAGVDAATGMPFLTMDLLEGTDLGSLLRVRGRFPGHEVVSLLSQAARGLDRVHAAGIVHRDLKPNNLFVARRDDGTSFVKVLDFGIARLVARGDKATRAIGTPLYMSREQILGEGTIGPPADVYALAHVAHTLLVGKAYWSVEDRAADNTFALLIKSTKGLAEPATARAAREGVFLPPAYDAWFARATALDPADRHTSAGELISDLSRALGDHAIATVPASLLRPAPALPVGAPRSRSMLVAGVAVGASFLLGGAAVWRFRDATAASPSASSPSEVGAPVVPVAPAPTAAPVDPSASSADAPPTAGPRSCADVRASHPEARDGDYDIVVGPGPGTLVRLYCHEMARAPREYLTLVRTRPTGAGNANCSHYGTNTKLAPAGQTTCFKRVRIFPSTLTVDVDDATFAIKDGTEVHFGALKQDAAPYATAGDCLRNGSQTGTANVDLTGTPFAVERDQFVLSGWAPAGKVTINPSSQVVELVGGGYCGSMGMATGASGRAALRLAWAHPKRP